MCVCIYIIYIYKMLLKYPPQKSYHYLHYLLPIHVLSIYSLIEVSCLKIIYA